jgi:hypothetical protein
VIRLAILHSMTVPIGTFARVKGGLPGMHGVAWFPSGTALPFEEGGEAQRDVEIRKVVLVLHKGS